MAKLTEYGIKQLSAIQLGKETVAGTAVLASTLWRGTGKLKDNRKVERPAENVAILPNTTRGYIPMTGCELTLDAVPATFEQLQILLDSGVSNVTPVVDGAGSDYISVYTFPWSTGSGTTIKSRTLEGNDNQEMDVAAYMFTREFTLKGEPQKAVTMEGVMEGRSPEPNYYTAAVAFVSSGKHITDAANGLGVFKAGMSIRVSGSVSDDGIYTVATSAAGDITVSENVTGETAVSCTIEQVFTAAATRPTVENILFGNGKLYVGSVGTAFSALAQVSNTWLGMTYHAIPGKTANFSGDGRLDFSYLTNPTSAIDVQSILAWNGQASAERRYAKLATPRKMRMKFEGAAVATAGTIYSKKTLIIDGCGLWDTFDTLGEQNGNSIVTAHFVYGYDDTAAFYHQITLVTERATVL